MNLMTLTSFAFLVFVALSLFLYYSTPLRFRWVTLLTVSLAFFALSSELRSIPFLILGIVIAYIGAWLIGTKCKTASQKKIILAVTLILIITELCLLKYSNFFTNTAGLFGRLFHISVAGKSYSYLAPLGISYYTLSIIGYVLGVYWQTHDHQKNPFKFALFTCYFPRMTSGPITNYKQMESELFIGKRCCYEGVRAGFWRMLWGYFKKMVIADRLAILVNTVYADTSSYPGFYVVVAVFAFVFQLYCDFSGCMDIVLGASEMFGIHLPENFDVPFSSQSISEFWRRWHITLGVWAKDNLLYPILKSRFIQKIGVKSKKAFGKKLGKKIPTYLGLVVIWLFIGIWHGGSYKFLFLSGILPGFYLIAGDFLHPVFEKLNTALHINTQCFSFRLFRRFRTILLMCTSWIFIPAASLKAGFQAWRDMLSTVNPWLLTDDSLFLLGLDYKDFFILFIALIAVVSVEILHYKRIKIRETLKNQNIAFQWVVTMAAIFIVLIYGIYGSGYNPADFIYGGF
jgi:D-alanyl-lipoteichoic acid acyltransferase DltB (MBOAT superfamily)